jgi:hypothetical protein
MTKTQNMALDLNQEKFSCVQNIRMKIFLDDFSRIVSLEHEKKLL